MKEFFQATTSATTVGVGGAIVLGVKVADWALMLGILTGVLNLLIIIPTILKIYYPKIKGVFKRNKSNNYECNDESN
ncbi:hypothetical protein [Microbulbifer epialgicus]|uniref:Membrane transport protein MMPL domain-containing protein n=1 Tax=Microbulbifer epialgicus TaxID=393907 RepID=A0ABV4P149_9GAMM